MFSYDLPQMVESARPVSTNGMRGRSAVPGKAWDAGQCGADAAGRSGRASAFPLPPGAAETDFVPDRRLLPSPAETAEAIMQAGEPGTGRATAHGVELLPTAGVGPRVCAGWF